MTFPLNIILKLQNKKYIVTLYIKSADNTIAFLYNFCIVFYIFLPFLSIYAPIKRFLPIFETGNSMGLFSVV